MSGSAANDFIAGLEAIARRIRQIEEEARDLLHVRRDEPGYRGLMQDKAMLLLELPEEAGPVPTGAGGFQPADARRIEAGLKDFARRAGQALDLDSVFYMSSLLYPDDYEDGEPNDLERFIARTRTSLT